ncbi:sesquiterpene synthase 9-like isoform X2 [Lycium ferocissimum]|uniref:sesquiterpene synthase 9-like isoform X2 n=1 Tax=Lycium ferocissimum TaxID=112874 RepID=UPI00281610F3|nr:sesquiterpene synthase 9-like isoform X2 [Lycium ferocissimum]
MSEAKSSRHLANYHPTVWGYHFLSYNSQFTEISTQEKHELEELKEKVRKMLVETPENSTQKLVLIDTIQRLGVAYHFDNEIETSMQNIFDASQLQSENQDNLYIVALRFRLLRQHGHDISSDVFKQFTDQDGKFKEILTNDVQGLLSLYEAAHLRVRGEEILEEALTFTTMHLEFMVPNLSNNSLKFQVTEALKQPIRKTLPRLGARKYIFIYENITNAHTDLLLKFAKLDFNALQKLHQAELSELTRWDISALDSLPPYMRPAYQALLDIYNENEEVLAKRCKSDRVNYAKNEMKKLVRAYFKEAQWLDAQYIPTCEENMKNALVSCAYMMLSTTSLVGMEEFISRETFEWMINEPLIVRASTVISRLMDDIAGHEDEQQRGHVASIIESYMKESGASKQEAYIEFQKEVTNAWKDINREFLHPTEVPMFVLERVLNLARVIDTLYQEKDGYTNSKGKLKDMINLLFVESVKI